MRLSLGRVEVGLALLEMLYLPGCILCANEAAVLAPYFVTFGGCVRILELYKRATNIRIRVATHYDYCTSLVGTLLPLSARWRTSMAFWPAAVIANDTEVNE